ncbi:hypothetical protein MD484_g5504, partial [Candolleomyces efflorescens]
MEVDPLNAITSNMSVLPLGAPDVRQLLNASAGRARCREGQDDNDGFELTSAPAGFMPDEGLDPRIVHAATAPTPESPPSCQISTDSQGGVHRRRQKDASKNRRGLKRQAQATSALPAAARRPRKIVMKAKDRIPAGVGSKDLPHSQSGSWVGLRLGARSKQPSDPKVLVGEYGYELVEWDGCTTKIFADDGSIGFVFLVGRPADPSWAGVCSKAAEALKAVEEIGRNQELFGSAYTSNRRGPFVAIPNGVSFGGGQTEPGNLVHSRALQILIQSLLKNQGVCRIAGFQSAAFATLAPELFRHYGAELGALFQRYPSLKTNFTNSIFPAASFNCGPQSISNSHFDSGNLSFGLCALTALGEFDHRDGGHLILHTLKKVVEFPPCSTILLPSAAVEHANSPIAPHELRYSIAQYASGGLFRWVAHDFKAAKTFNSTKKGKAKRLEIDGLDDERWLNGINLYPKLSQIS